MMVQTAFENEPHFVMTMNDHTEFCAQMARAYGNDRFERLDPLDEMVHLVSKHDCGWDFYDADPGLDPDTGLPFTMIRTPTPYAMKTNSGSPDANEQFSAYSGLLSSMHTWGLYNKRYGYSRFVVPSRSGVSITLKPEFEQMKQDMLQGELDRQARLKEELEQDPKTAALVADKHLFQNYKQLQFFDTMALYFNTRHGGERGDELYIHVPVSAEEDSDVMVRKIDEATYTLDPFPFKVDKLKLVARGKYMKPLPAGTDLPGLGKTLSQIADDRQEYLLMPA
jgi:hypothetical protein